MTTQLQFYYYYYYYFKWPLFPSIVRCKNDWICNSTRPPYALHEGHEKNFTCLPSPFMLATCQTINKHVTKLRQFHLPTLYAVRQTWTWHDKRIFLSHTALSLISTEIWTLSLGKWRSIHRQCEMEEHNLEMHYSKYQSTVNYTH